MRQIDYELKQANGDSICITSYDTAKWDELKGCPAIKVAFVSCRDGKNKVFDILDATNLNNVPAKFANAFRAHPLEFLQNPPGDWKLVKIIFEDSIILFAYYDVSTDDLFPVPLSIGNDSAKSLDFAFYVPHQSQRPDTKYAISMNYHEKTLCSPANSETIIEEYLPDKRTVFLLDSNHPNKISITEYIDF